MDCTLGLLTHNDRVALTHTADILTAITVEGCSRLAVQLHKVAQGAAPSSNALAQVSLLGRQVRAALLAGASPERWLDAVSEMSLDLDTQFDVVSSLIAERQFQAGLVTDAVALCETLGTYVTVNA